MNKCSLVLVAALAIGCNRGNSGELDEQTAALCDLFRVACERQAECGVYIYSRATDADRCQEQLACEEFVAGLNAADILVSVDDAKACRDALDTATCEGLLLWDGFGPHPLVQTEASCLAVYAGQRAAGETCGWNEQCEAGLECVGETCPGTCQEPIVGCTIGGCGDDAYCGSDGTCIPRGASGATCGITNEFENACADGLWCDIPFAQIEGTCKPQIARGESCQLSSFFTCADGDVCYSGTCQAPTPEGAPCSAGDECGYGSFCAFDAGNVCKPWLALGEPCTLAFAACGPNARCGDTSRVCEAVEPSTGTAPPPPTGTPRPFVGEGEDCADANCGLGLACRPRDEQWRCEKAAKIGESCRPANPEDEFVLLLLSGVNGVGGCIEGVCDVLGSWTCVVPAGPGEACDTPGLTAACASVVCKPDGTCADYFEECPFGN